MHLFMVIGDDIIDSVPVEPHRCKQPVYLEAMQRCLKMKHVDLLLNAKQTPSFYLQAPSSMNKTSK